ncbi:MAG: hypothetical protein KF901_24665 [Myxococcales bacterium]|nr:hypothetical protein [Myxococcales bacterium]
MTKLGPWTWPTLLGPFLPGWALVTWAAVVGEQQLRALFDVDGWAIAMLLVSVFSAVVAFHLVVVDVLLLKLKWRALPTGVRGWLSAMLAPIATIVALVGLGGGDGARGALVIALGFTLGALTPRLLLGKRP